MHSHVKPISALFHNDLYLKSVKVTAGWTIVSSWTSWTSCWRPRTRRAKECPHKKSRTRLTRSRSRVRCNAVAGPRFDLKEAWTLLGGRAVEKIIESVYIWSISPIFLCCGPIFIKLMYDLLKMYRERSKLKHIEILHVYSVLGKTNLRSAAVRGGRRVRPLDPLV